MSRMPGLLLSTMATAILHTVVSSRLKAVPARKPVPEPSRQSAIEGAWKAVLDTDNKERSYWLEASEIWSWATRGRADVNRPSRARMLENVARVAPKAEATGTLAAWNAAADKFTAALDALEEAKKKLVAAEAAAKVRRKDKKTKNIAEQSRIEAWELETEVARADKALRVATKAAAKFHPEAAAAAAKDAEFEAMLADREAKAKLKAATEASTKRSLEQLLQKPAEDKRELKIASQ